MWVLIVSATVLVIALALAALLWRGTRQIRQLTGVDPTNTTAWPDVSVVIPARNEADTIEPALRSLLALDYPHLELIAVNDRSGDATGRILDSLAADDPRLSVIHIDTLPDGWLGKTHALHRGAGRATGDYLLFTDADVHMKPETLRHAIGHMKSEALDHLVVLPRVTARGDLLRALMMLTIVSLLVLFRPWAVRRRRDRFMGAGAFNLLRREAYEAFGGHRPLALAPVDDIELGRLVKHRGLTQEAVQSNGLVNVEWYPDIRSVVSGLEKNVFAVLDFRLWKLILGTTGAVITQLWPLFGLFLGDGAARWLNLATLITVAGLWAGTAGALEWNRRCVLAVPVATVLLLYIWWRGTVLTLLRGGIVWRGTFYPLERLKTFQRKH